MVWLVVPGDLLSFAAAAAEGTRPSSREDTETEKQSERLSRPGHHNKHDNISTLAERLRRSERIKTTHATETDPQLFLLAALLFADRPLTMFARVVAF